MRTPTGQEQSRKEDLAKQRHACVTSKKNGDFESRPQMILDLSMIAKRIWDSTVRVKRMAVV